PPPSALAIPKPSVPDSNENSVRDAGRTGSSGETAPQLRTGAAQSAGPAPVVTIRSHAAPVRSAVRVPDDPDATRESSAYTSNEPPEMSEESEPHEPPR